METIMKFLKTSILVGLLASAVFVSAQDATPTSGPCADPANEFLNWTSQDGNCALHDEVSFTVDVSYPQALAEAHPFTKIVMLDYVNRARTEFWTNVGELLAPDFGAHNFPWILQTTAETIEHSPQIVSVVFSSYSFTGGAHGGTIFTTFTFDLENETVLTLEDLFATGVDPYAVLSEISRKQLTVTLADFPDFIEAGTEPTPENFANWVLTPDSLVLYFEEYQVAPYAAGPQKVTIPLTDLADVLNPDVVCIPGTEC
jgi:hypothetical protein